MLKARTEEQQKLTASWPQVFLSLFQRYQVEVTCTPPWCLEAGLAGFELEQQLLMSLFGIQRWEAQGLSVNSMRCVVLENVTRCSEGTTTKNLRAQKEDDPHFGVWNANVKRKMDWTPFHSPRVF